LLHPAAEPQVPLGPVGAAVRGALPPLLLSRDVGHPTPGAEVHLAVPVGESRPGDDARDANDHGGRPAALAEVHVRLSLGPGAAERVVATLGEVWRQRAGVDEPVESLLRIPVPQIIEADRL